MFPSIIANHNFYETEQKRMAGIAQTPLIFELLDLTLKVINEKISRLWILGMPDFRI